MIGLLNNDYVNNFQSLQKARKDLIGEIEAVIQYDEHAMSTANIIEKQTWLNIRNEELVHIGELLAILNFLNPEQKKFVEKGIEEFNERLKR